MVQRLTFPFRGLLSLDSNPRPPRCEREKHIHKTRCCDHLRHARGPLNGVLGVPMETLVYRLLPAIEF